MSKNNITSRKIVRYFTLSNISILAYNISISCKQECIPVGCVPSTAVGGVCIGGVCPRGCLPGGVSAWGVYAQGVCPEECPPRGWSTWDRMPLRTERQISVKTLLCRNYVEDGKKLALNIRLTLLNHKGFGYEHVYTHEIASIQTLIEIKSIELSSAELFVLIEPLNL